MDVSIFWIVFGLAALLILAAGLLMVSRRRSEPIPFEHPRIEPVTRPSWAEPVPEDEPPPPPPSPLPTQHGEWTPKVSCSDGGSFAPQFVDAIGNYFIRGHDATVDCEVAFHLNLSNAIGDAFVDGIPIVAANDTEVVDASLEELEGAARDRIPLRAVIFKNDTRMYLGISGREFRCGPTYRLRFRARYSAETD